MCVVWPLPPACDGAWNNVAINALKLECSLFTSKWIEHNPHTNVRQRPYLEINCCRSKGQTDAYWETWISGWSHRGYVSAIVERCHICEMRWIIPCCPGGRGQCARWRPPLTRYTNCSGSMVLGSADIVSDQTFKALHCHRGERYRAIVIKAGCASDLTGTGLMVDFLKQLHTPEIPFYFSYWYFPLFSCSI